jgi:hypothetical protein
MATDTNQGTAARWLYRLCLAVAGGLILLVVAAPWLDNKAARWLTLFAQDRTLRRTTLASAAGMIVTASVFFRPAALATARRGPPRERRPPPPTVAGA